ncbi:lasso peptide biosynthesis PqqD family chaperone (plasmid) [Streptosporangium sp. CA-135522]|uniref:lasso peptide biosynthesis PqqD family chaperone n=1 Tax=Streptosporangium sp. CA-135522 TaxID=3240072 RepID=UPI003D910F81
MKRHERETMMTTPPSFRDGISRAHTDYGDVILDEISGHYWHANPTAALVLETIEHGGDAADAAGRLVAEFGVDSSVARADVDELLSRLRKLGVLR